MKSDTDISYMALNKARDKRKVKREKRQKAMLAGGTSIKVLYTYPPEKNSGFKFLDDADLKFTSLK
jgi:hypothetical protein